ncbi:MAG: crossover junction endodeoxyribonuclease RuvC [Candidatus Marinimicrobia bacterium]|nr:crossover junction endodeoxyribonuclease RuvC [Candidatus Neomarinimicrobiota bacterium]
MIILGVDPGLNVSGYGIILLDRSRIHFVAAGAISTSKAGSFPEKLAILHRTCTEIIDDHKPDVFAIEETFSNINPRTSLKLGHARGVLILAAEERDCPVFEYPATIVKKALTGVGSASKEQVRYMVMKMLKIQELTGSMDVTDALAVAITHYHQIRFNILKTGRQV